MEKVAKKRKSASGNVSKCSSPKKLKVSTAVKTTSTNTKKRATSKAKTTTKKSTSKSKEPAEDDIEGATAIDLCSDDDEDDTAAGDFNIWDAAHMLHEVSGVNKQVCNNFVRLIEDENTLPFIARYRKSMVEQMTPEALQDLYESFTHVCQMKKRALTILKALKKSGKLTPNLESTVLSARSMGELDLLYEPLKTRRGTLADQARKLGLENAALTIYSGGFVSSSQLCNPSKDGLKTVEEVETNLMHLLADIIYKDAKVLEYIRKLKTETKIYIESCKAKTTTKKSVEKSVSTSKHGHGKECDADKYHLYFNFNMRVDYLKSHQILALNRGENVKALTVKVNIPDWFYNNLERFCLTLTRPNELIKKSINHAYSRFIKPWITRQVRSDLTSRAEKESIAVFASNLKRLLMTAPIKDHNIVGIDPGFKAGCKVGVIDTTGSVLETCVLHPNFHNENKKPDYQVEVLQRLIEKHGCGVIALGNGTACRETEQWLKKWGVADSLPLVIVPEQGASIYSCSPEATKEHPGMDPNLISAISIARRALDPLSELVKVDPKHVGVGMYQHDAPPKLLNEALTSTVVNCASFVGADLNTASLALLRRIAGLTETRAKAILKHREKIGGFSSREELLKVTGIGPKTYKQCAGFIRVPQSKNKLDNTWIHPESYDIAERLLKEFSLKKKDIFTDTFIKELGLKSSRMGMSALCAKLQCSESDAQLIVEALQQSPHVDPLRNAKPVYSVAINNISQLKEGAKLAGVVSNVTPFGCFVDCGIGQNGLIHTSQMGGSRIPQLGERVLVTVIPPLTHNRIPLRLEEITG